MTGVRINKSAVINLLIQSQSITQRDRMSRVTRRNQPRHDSKQPRQGPVGFVCSRCSRVFNTKWNRDEHELTHMNIRIQCPHCERDFSNRSNLSRHIKEVHSKIFVSTKVGTLYSCDGTRYHCGECSSVYESKEEDAYWDHIQTHM